MVDLTSSNSQHSLQNQIGNSWVVPKEGFHLLLLNHTGLCILPRIPNQKWTFVFCLAPASCVDLAFPLTSVLSAAWLDTCASPNWSPDTTSHPEPKPQKRTLHDKASRGITLENRAWEIYDRLPGVSASMHTPSQVVLEDPPVAITEPKALPPPPPPPPPHAPPPPFPFSIIYTHSFLALFQNSFVVYITN